MAFWPFTRKGNRADMASGEHKAVEARLDEHEQRLKEMAKRLRTLEIEAGIYKPPLRGRAVK